MIYDKKFFVRTACVLIALVAMLMATDGSGYVLILPFALVAFFQRKPEMVLYWMMISTTLLMGNSYLMPKNVVFLTAQRVMVVSFGALMMLMITTGRKTQNLKPFLLLYPYLFFMILSSAFGWSPVISYLKLLLFIVVYMAYLGVANQAALSSRSKLPKLRAMVLAIAAFYIIGSILLVPFPVISQLRGEEYVEAIQSGRNVTSLFKGMALHSQSLGPIVATLATFIFADWTLAVRTFSKLHAVLLLLCPILIYKTSSRTAMGGFLAGVLCVCYCIVRERGIGLRWRMKVKKAILLMFVLLVGAVLFIPAARDRVVRYALKFDQSAKASDFNMETVVASRQGAMESQLHNFKRSLLVGNGFQVSEELKGFKSRRWTDLLSAPVEKGVWITAILEEGGIVGFMLFLLFLIPAVFQLLKCRAFMTLSMFVTMMVLNLGEFVLFSMTAAGGFCWLFVFTSAVFDTVRLRDNEWGTYQWHRNAQYGLMR